MRLFSTPLAAIATGCLLLGASPALAAQTFAPVEGGKVAYETCGSGPKAIVLLHDGILDSSAFDAVWPKLCARFKVVRYDRRVLNLDSKPEPFFTSEKKAVNVDFYVKWRIENGASYYRSFGADEFQLLGYIPDRMNNNMDMLD